MAELINLQILNRLLGWAGVDLPPTHLAGFVLAALVHGVILLGIVAVAAMFFIWAERKIAGRIQDRLGPTRVGGRFGWLQALADGIKLLCKEDVRPREADSLLFRCAPYVSFAASFTAYLALPFSDGWVAQHINSAVFFILAVLGIEVFGVILAGYASGSKWSLFGAMRESAQVVSYEVPLGLCVVVPVFICGTMNLVTIGNMQTGWLTNWLVFHDPFTFTVFWVYVTCAIASVNRAPFDLAEAESELVAGFHTEYSGMRWCYFFMAEYGSMLLVSGLAAILFFGGWHGPVPVFDMLGWSDRGGVLQYAAELAGAANFVLKAVIGVTVMIWVRWTLPRLRIDQVMTTCLKYCTPLAAVCFLGALGWQTGLFGLASGPLWSPNQLMAVKQRGEYRESWVLKAESASAADSSARQASRSAPNVNRDERNVSGATEPARSSATGAVGSPSSRKGGVG